jgi:hypothetical protein
MPKFRKKLVEVTASTKRGILARKLTSRVKESAMATLRAVRAGKYD